MSLLIKPVRVSGIVVGYARTWEDAARLLGWPGEVVDLQHHGAEGPDAFHLRGRAEGRVPSREPAQ